MTLLYLQYAEEFPVLCICLCVISRERWKEEVIIPHLTGVCVRTSRLCVCIVQVSSVTIVEECVPCLLV